MFSVDTAGRKTASSTGPDSVKGLITELEAIINSSYDGIFITDGTGVVLRMNEAYERITGIKAAEILGCNMASLVTDGVYDQSVTMLVMERLESITINQIVKKSNKHILVTGNPIFDEQGRLFRVVTNVRDVTELNRLEQKLSKTKEERQKYQAELSHLRSLQVKDSDIVYRSRAMAAVLELAGKVADVSSNVLITGESGTGKELVAKYIHRKGKGDKKPFIRINCGAIPDNLMESELFGYEAGAFTGAKKEGKPGLFELANGGTLFLDEIGELPLFLQVKLLRALQDRTVTRVGGVAPIKIDVRIVSATHRNLDQMVKVGTFREDLYYRLMVVPIHIPPLRDRQEDIPLLAVHFVEKLNGSFGFTKVLLPEVVDRLAEYAWPGNVRELENVIERMIVTTPADEMDMSALPASVAARHNLPKTGTKLKEAVAATERFLLEASLDKYGSLQAAADALGIDRTTCFRKAFKYGLVTKR